MPASDRPYKSRLLTLLNQQAMGWSDRLSRSARHLQVWLLWSAQILAYPVYLLAQSSRSFGRKLGQALGAVPKLPETDGDVPVLPSDTPIRRTLAAVAPAEKPTAACGLACTLDSRDLAFSTADNQIINSLSRNQQQAIQQRLRYELASYYHYRQAQRDRAQQHQIPAALTDGDRLPSPLRWFWHAMRWVQRSPVAIAIDLFDEAQLIDVWQPNLPSEPPLPLPLLPPVPLAATLARLDTVLANWEQRPRQWGDRWQKLPLARALRGAHLPWATPALPTAAVEPPPVEPPPKSLWLAWEELYGFAEPPLPLVLAAPVRDRQHPLPSDPVPESLASRDPWLAWEDAYDSTAGLRIDMSPSLPLSAPLTLAPAAAPRSPIPAAVPMTHPSDPPKPQRPQPESLAAQPIRPAESRPHPAAPPLARQPDPTPDPALAVQPPETIEVEAEASGYVQHPLAAILGWLDAMLYWLEEVAIALWHWLKRRLL